MKQQQVAKSRIFFFYVVLFDIKTEILAMTLTTCQERMYNKEVKYDQHRQGQLTLSFIYLHIFYPLVTYAV